ncbi:hypothetical protein D917_02942 [Trichinella nativa]|uniref:Uncharacterized protein n=1 Tax=Trichinella nativa TaxID=6335 RepID=A0A1Y3ECN6_9BILA|nr:hypothetical protein D917_02942 [Trichinella nativa]
MRELEKSFNITHPNDQYLLAQLHAIIYVKWSEIIARPAIGHLTRAHHCERGDIGRRALNLPGYCLYRQCRFQHCSFCWPLAESVCFSLRSFSGQAARPIAELFRPLSLLIC